MKTPPTARAILLGLLLISHNASAETIRMARLAKETGLFPVFEAVHGEVTAVSKIRSALPVEEYLRPQQRFAHLFRPPGHPEIVARLQQLADRNIRRYGLLEGPEARQ